MKILLIIFLPLVLLAGEVQLVWDPNPAEDLVIQYYVYEHLTNGQFVVVGKSATNGIHIMEVIEGNHCYVVTASNYWGESEMSDEACTHVKDNPFEDREIYADNVGRKWNKTRGTTGKSGIAPGNIR